MNGLRRHPLRVITRLARLAVAITISLLDYLFRCAFRRPDAKLAARAAWLHRASGRTLRFFRIKTQATGPVPVGGLLISNHLSYLDILVLSSLTPAVFVSKHDVKFWPVFGQFAVLGGTVFVDRARRFQVGRVNEEITGALNQGALVVLFPEGTSSNGQTLLPFKSSLLEPATDLGWPLAIDWIHYEIDDGDAGEEVCYWGNHTFFPHMLNLLSKRQIQVTVRFGQFPERNGDRKELAQRLRAEILGLKDGLGASP
ncbi:MAG TPA: lysophospholipid acyltransferase family protein [Candidatus Acidoferrales bacterium]|nr:lysophospholipid acyltransferase family protein [Candidatus Acidoferrales bacterium]